MDSAERELLCQECGVEYPIWYCDHFLWNPVAERLTLRSGVTVRFLCLNCFAVSAERIVKEKSDGVVIWKLDVGSPNDAGVFMRKSRDEV